MSPRDASRDRLLMRSDQLELLDRSVEQKSIEGDDPDAGELAGRSEYRERLQAALPDLRTMEGFPVGLDNAIVALSDPPYYTACPNPFVAEFVAAHGSSYDEANDDYHREPFAADVSEGKNDPIYTAHSYPTKIPHRAIIRYILHYTDPEDIILDGFCGTGMTGVAAQLCGEPDTHLRTTITAEWEASEHSPPKWGARRAVLCDLAPAATLLARNYNTPLDVAAFKRDVAAVSGAIETELGPLYQTSDPSGSRIGWMDYAVWSDVFLCPTCGAENLAWNVVPDFATDTMRSTWACGSCGAEVLRRQSKRQFNTLTVDGSTRQVAASRLAMIQFSVGTKSRRKTPDPEDRDLALVPPGFAEPPNVPWIETPHGHNLDQPRKSHGVTYLAQFFAPRTRVVFGRLLELARSAADPFQLLAVSEDIVGGQVSRRNRWLMDRHHRGGTTCGPLSNTLFLPELQSEVNVLDKWRRSARKVVAAGTYGTRGNVIVSTQSCTQLGIQDSTIDYIFTDPPFGGNIMYSELNLLWEAWTGVLTNPVPEAIANDAQRKGLADYQRLMESCFREYWRVLKPGRWMTVVFHNSSNAVWNAIQEAMQRAGFVVADVRVMDKRQGTIRQDAQATVKQDLVISAYKPRSGFERAFAREAGTEQGAWDFVRQHMDQLPIFVERNGQVEVVAERQNYLLFDRMVAFHIQRGSTVPLSAARFYEGLRQRFPERDGMYFTELQVADYDRRRLDSASVEQISVYVTDEKSAIQWIRSELAASPQTFQELQPKFLRELNQNLHEDLPELRDILAQNFLEDPETRRWRVPDPGKQADLEALRQRGLLSEFATYVPGTAKLRRFRIEAVRAGFADLWAQRDYAGIIRLRERMPDEVIQEDPALLMYYDNAVTREGAG
jgi:hypothetical protein